MPTAARHYPEPIRLAALAVLLQVTADPIRAQILLMLGDGARSADEMMAEVGHSSPALCHHTTILQIAGLAEVIRRDGRRKVYALTADGEAMHTAIAALGGRRR